MGQKQSTSKNGSMKTKNPKLKEQYDIEDDIEEVDEEAQPYVVAKFKYKRSDGDTQEVELRINSSTTKASTVKRSLEKRFGIKENTVQVYLENGSEKLPDDCTLFDLGITDNATFIVRDGQ